VPTCPSGHDSASDDFCDVCGVLIGAAPSLAAEAAGTLAGPSSGTAGPAGRAGPPAVAGEPCPRCGNPRTGQFCESCGYDFTSAAAAAPAPPPTAPPPASLAAPLAPQASPDPLAPPASPDPVASPSSSATLPGPPAPLPVPTAPVPPRPVSPGSGLTAVVTADRAFFDSVQAASGPDADDITFPVYCPQRRFPLTGTELRIGRRSARSGIDPEIDLTGPPVDPGVSRLHAVLLRGQDGSWSVIDPGSANGTFVNGSEIPRDQVVSVRPGDRIHLGAWTAISIVGDV
jgi:hypothetical protein